MLNKFNKTSIDKRSPVVRGSSLFGKVNGAIALGLMLLVLPACDATDDTTTTTTTTAPGTDTTTTPGTGTTMTPGTGTTTTPGTGTTMTPGTGTTTTPGTGTTMTPGTGTTTTPGMGTTGTGMIADLSQVADNPSQFMGQTVTLNGEVAEVLGPNVFRIQEDQLIGGNDIIVITTGSQSPVMEDSQVQVTGEVRQLVITEIDRDYNPGWDDTTRTRIEREYTDRPAIVAQSVQPMMTNP